LNSFAVVLKIALGLISSKVMAVFLGPNGLALLGNFKSFLTSVEAVGSLGIQNGITKYVAENNENESLKKYLSTIFFSVLLVVLTSSVILFFGAGFWSEYVFDVGKNYQFIFKILAFALPFYVGGIVLLAVLNGFEAYKKVVFVGIVTNVLSLFLTVFLVVNYRIFGAIAGVFGSQVIQFFVVYFYASKQFSIDLFFDWNNFDFKILKKLLSFSVMTLVSTIVTPMVFLAIRKNVIAVLGLNQAGYWAAVDGISSYYFLFITTLLGVYFYPKLAVASNGNATKLIFLDYLKNIIPVFAFGLLMVYLLKDFIIHTLFTPQFEPSTKLFLFQLLGDFFKAISLIFAYQIIAKKHTVAFVIFEILSVTIFYFSSLLFIQSFGIQGIVMAHCFSYFLYLIVLFLYCYRKFLTINAIVE
jgi:O-antigen/teichoic acid export membrane protein